MTRRLPFLAAVVLLAGCSEYDRQKLLPRPVVADRPIAAGVQFAGLADRAATVAYVIDTTGANAPAFKYVQAELLRSIDALRPTQRFAVVLFGAQSPKVLRFDGRARLAPADAGNKQAARRFILGHHEQGSADEGAAWRAMQAAFDLGGGRPEVIFLLASRAWAEGLAERISQVNTPARPGGSAPVRVHAVGFLHPRAQEQMRQIAQANGGQSRLLQAVDLGKDR